ncbi:OmpA family protein [Fusobacterium sp. FSA-380-WT-3A]|uniref:OmpA family protein n=1 Tax=Fusobacterium sp. FSA-380-WT-3A TaxID=2725304 RepID=UPI001476B0FC|nr:OmpA family protein [Fusobacterium sp. FSA-380-WT-3A]NME36500.1 OmpA family protein [Fusobacterium sp. FSA-380-WT-3A]
MINKIETEKALKKYLKKKGVYSFSVLVGFLITGNIVLGAEFSLDERQELLKSEKEKIAEKILELRKDLFIIKNAQDKSTHIITSVEIGRRSAHHSSDKKINEEPSINIPDIRDDVKPNVPDIDNPLPNEDSIVKEPEFKFDEVGEVAINDKLPDIDLNLGDLTMPVEDIKDENFNTLTNGISTPKEIEVNINTNMGNITQQVIKTNTTAPTINEVVDLSLFEVKTITVGSPNVTTPDSFSLDTVKIKTGSFSQDTKTDYAKRKENPDNLYIVKNYTEYKADEEGFNIWVNQDSLFYDNKASGGNKQLTVIKDNKTEILGYEDENGQTGKYTDKYKPYNTSDKAGLTTTFISDAIGENVTVSGKYHLTYEGNRYGIIDNNNLYVRTFLSSSSYGLNSSKENIKLTEFTGELNLATTDNNANIIDYPDKDTNGDGVIDNTYDDTINKLNGNLIGLEHQIWDYDNDKNSILLNSGKINIGMNINRTGNNINKAINKNMIGIMIDSAQSSSNKKKNNQTINAGEINIIKPEYNLPNTRFTPRNNIGISFEENESGNKAGAILRDNVYIGKINIGDNTTQNYGFRMGNIYNNSNIYFDKTKIIGNLNNDETTITIKNDDRTDRVIKDYTSDIVVAGKQNAGMVVGKSLSSNASDYKDIFGEKKVNPIANFENISIKVDGDQTIGFVRDKNYSDNNTNDMVITDNNLNNVRFGANAKNSVLFRSEMYGITNGSTIDVTVKERTVKENSNDIPTYNVAMQAMAQTWDGTKDINSSGSVTNGIEVEENGKIVIKGTISGTTNNMIGMMASGEITLGDGENNSNWQNGDKLNEGKALATNKGEISLTGNNNIGMAIMDDNKGSNSGTIEIIGEKGVGIYNTGTFENNSGTVTVNGKDGIGIYNDNSLTLAESTINIGGENSVGVYSKGGTIDFGKTTIKGDGNAIVGIYTTKNETSTMENNQDITPDVTLKGEVSIDGTKVGLVSDGGITKVDAKGNIGYSGNGFALQTINNGKIVFDKDSTLTLGGSAYGININAKDKGEVGKYINFNGARIKITSNNVTLFNIDGNNENYSSEKIESGDTNLPGEPYLKDFVGEFILDKNGYEGYKIASIENGNILLNSSEENNNNEGFLRQYKFQRSRINMITDTNHTLSNEDASTYFNGEVIGIGISSTSNIKQDYTKGQDGKTIGEQQREETQINITNNSTLTANRTDKAPEISQENKNTKSTIGAYIDYGVINIGEEQDKAGHIIVENSDSNNGDEINNNGIGIFSKNGSKVTVNKGSSITVYGKDGIGIYGEATKEFYKNEDGTIDTTKNKFGGNITKLEITNAGKIDVSSGIGGVGIFADAREEKENRGTVTNFGTIIVGEGITTDSSVGIYGKNTEITNTGSITVGSNKNNKDNTGVGIYAENSNVILGDKTSTDKKVEFTLGDGATGIYLDGDSNLTLENELVFNSLNPKDSVNTTNRIGIYAKGEEGKNNSDISINKNIDISNVIGGKAVIVDNRNINNTSEITISGNNGRGIRVLNNGTITNNGKIIVGESMLLSETTEEFKGSSIGMVAANKNGKIDNEGTIDINSTSGIGIYVDNTNNTEEKDKNSINSIGNINLNGDKNIGVVAKATDLEFGNGKLTTSGITFGNSNGVGVYAENSNITINEDISRNFEGNQTNNILIASIGKDNSKTKVVTNNGDISLNGKNNIGIYLSGNTKYTSDIDNNSIKGSIKVSDGAIGIYANKGVKDLENINIKSISTGEQTIGVVLQGTTDKEKKNINGDIILEGIGEGKNIGVYANSSNVVVEEGKILTLSNNGSNGTGIYLKDSTLSGSGTVKITGEGINNKNSVGIYYASENENPIISDNAVKVEIDKSNTIGVYVANESILTKQSSGGVTIGTSNTQVENVTGLLASSDSTINNKGFVTLNNTSKSIGIASLGGIINNSGTITLGENANRGTGIFLTGNSKLENTGTIIINEKAETDKENPQNSHLGIGIYTKGENVEIGSTGNFEMASGNIAIYSDGTNISSDIILADNSNLEKNSGTTALVVKSDKDSTDANVTKGTTIGGTDEKRMNITLAKGSTGIYALDSGVSISNVSIDAKAHYEDNDKLSYGIYLKSEKDGNYNISNTDIDLVKGVGIVVGTSTDNSNTKLTLSGSTINIDSYSEGNDPDTGVNKKETGIGIYTNSGKIALTGGNTINTSYGVGIYGGNGSEITTSNGDTLNLQGYSVGVYSKGGNVTLGEGTKISFDNSIETPVVSGKYQGAGAYVLDGNLTSSANITNENSKDADGIIGLLGKQNGAIKTEVTNNGEITLSGKSVVGMAGLGNKGRVQGVSIKNNNKITIEGVIENKDTAEEKIYLSTGIYGDNVNIFNNRNGKIEVGDYATGIYYIGTKTNDITNNGTINISGIESTGIVLNGIAGNVSLGNISGNTNGNRNLGIYLNNYSATSTNIGNITLGDESLGLYINNSSTTINSLGDITTGKEGIGIASVGKIENNTIDDKTIINSNGKISVGEKGTAIYVKDSNLTMKTLGEIDVSKNGALLHVNNGVLDFTNNTLTSLEVNNGNIGMILENGGDITSTNGQKISNIEVTGGGAGVVIKGSTTNTPNILDKQTTISLGSGVSIGKKENNIEEFNYSVGVYYKESNILSENQENPININIVHKENSHHTIGTIYDRTYGTIENFNSSMCKTSSYSIGTIIRRENYNEATDKNNNNSVTLNAGENLEFSQGKTLVEVNGKYNIGILGKNSVIVANGDIKVGLDENVEKPNENKNSIGVYLTANNKGWKHSYTGTGDIEVGSHSYGIYSKNYNVTHNGNVTAKGKESVGIAGVIEDKNNQAHDHMHTVAVKDGIITVSDGAIGVFGRDTNIEVANGDLEVSGENTTGIASIHNGNITYNGTANVFGKGTAGIYKNTVLNIEDLGKIETREDSNQDSKNTITVGAGEWEVNNLATGIMAISRTKKDDGTIDKTGESIIINNSSNMTLGDGSIGIYSVGKNIVDNKGNISVGGALMDIDDKTYASIGIYMANGIGGERPRTTGTNSGTITVANNGGVGVQVVGYVDFTNSGKINIENGGVGMQASYGATVVNAEGGNITVTGKGTGMIATGTGSQAINNGTINLEKGEYSYGNNDNLPYNTLLIGMGAINGGTITNGEKGIININDGIGMYIDSSSAFENNGALNVNNGVGIMGVGELKNTGKINITSSNGIGTVELDKNLSDKGSLVIDKKEGILEVNDNFSNIGGILETDYNIKLNNPTIDITAGGAGFIAPEMSGDIKLDSNFALEGDGLSYTVEDFIDPSADININTSPLFDTELVEGDLTVSKVDYKDISVGSRYDSLEDSLDNILVNGGKDSEVLKNLNYYLDSLGNTTVFNSEYNRIMGEISGLNTYSNLQSRMQDISRVYDNSFKELIGSGTPTYENSKFNIIYTDNEYTNNNENIAGYKYYTKGVNYMKEFDGLDRYGYTLGFTGTEFKFDGSATEEDVYSLRGGIHRIKEYDNGITFTTRGDIGYNYHRMDRNINNNSINRKAHYGSYQIGLDNQLRKSIFVKDNSNVGIYTGLNLEYGIFEHIKEKGDIGIEVKSNDYFSSKAMLGLNGNISKNLGEKWRVSLLGDVNYSYDFGTNYDENRVRTINSSTGYSSLEALEKTRGVVAGEIGVNFDKEDYLTIGLKGRTERDFERDEDYWSVGLTFTFRFNDYGIPENLLNVKSLFGFDKDKAVDKELESVKEVAQYVKDNNVDGKILIEGHTDSIGKEKYNKGLSERRVKSIEKEVVNILGDASKIETRIIETKAYGETKPAVSNSTREGRAQNRRVEVSIIEK